MKADVLIEKLRHDGSPTDKFLASMSDRTLGVTDLHVSKYGVYLIASEDNVMTIGDLLDRMVKGTRNKEMRPSQTVMLGEMYGDSNDRRVRTHEIGHVEYSDGVFVIFAEG